MTRSGGATLEQRLHRRIDSTGPMDIASYMAECLGAQDLGYYRTTEPFGPDGDFTTAPEISGLFGEMMAVYLAHLFELSGGPGDAVVAELGPGRGTLMRDMRHVWKSVMPELGRAETRLVETSPRLAAIQRECLGEDARLFWHDDCAGMCGATSGPLFGIANEFFDALPVEQFSFRQGRWRQRLVGLEDGRMTFVAGAPAGKARAARLAGAPASDGMIAEICDAADEIAGLIAGVIAKRGGAFLIIDYGRNGNPGDSLQAVAEHRPVDPFYRPGHADLSHWVDFAAISRAVDAAGARMIGPVPQGDFLTRIGIGARAENAGRFGDPQQRRALLAEVERLTSHAHMGALFKVALIVPGGSGLPPGFKAADNILSPGRRAP